MGIYPSTPSRNAWVRKVLATIPGLFLHFQRERRCYGCFVSLTMFFFVRFTVFPLCEKKKRKKKTRPEVFTRTGSSRRRLKFTFDLKFHLKFNCTFKNTEIFVFRHRKGRPSHRPSLTLCMPSPPPPPLKLTSATFFFVRKDHPRLLESGRGPTDHCFTASRRWR